MIRQTISHEYAEMNRQLHNEKPEYGAAAENDAPAVAKYARKVGAKTLLDFGCGKGTLKPALMQIAPEISVFEYDPAVPGKEALPAHAVDVVAAMDVMEHIEPDYLTAVLQTMISLQPKIVIMKISLTPAKKNVA